VSCQGDRIIQNLYVKHQEIKLVILDRVFRLSIDDDSLLLEVAGVSYWGEHAVKLLRTYARHPELTDLQLEVIDRLTQLESEKFY
jgi:hypothetical protein